MGAEKRRSKRIPITMHLEVSSLFKQDNVHVKNINAPVEITDISRNGIGDLQIPLILPSLNLPNGLPL